MGNSQHRRLFEGTNARGRLDTGRLLSGQPKEDYPEPVSQAPNGRKLDGARRSRESDFARGSGINWLLIFGVFIFFLCVMVLLVSSSRLQKNPLATTFKD